MGVLYARVNGAWTPVIASPPPPADEVWVGPAAPTASETELWVDSDLPAPMLFARIGGNWTQVSAPPTNEVAVQPDAPTGSEELWYDTDAPGVTPDDLRWMSAWGVIGHAAVTSEQNGVTTTVPITGMTCNATLVAGRRYKVTMTLAPRHTTTDTISIWTIRKASTDIVIRAISGVALANLSNTAQLQTVFTEVTGGTYTFSGTMARQGGSGTVSNYGDATVSSFIAVEDVGPVSGAYPAVPPAIDRWNTAWGQVAGTWTGTPVTATTSYTNLCSVTFTAVAGRRYSITAQSPLRPSTAGALSYLELYDTTAGTTLRESFESIPVAQYYQTLVITWFWSPAAGNRTITLRAKTSSGTVESVVAGGGIAASLLIEDVGPVSGALAAPDPTPAWIAFTSFQNGWVNYGVSRSTSSYRLRGDMVDVRLAVKSGTAGTVITTLPVGYRPPGVIDAIGRDGNPSPPYSALINIDPDGTLKWFGNVANNAILALITSFSVTP